MSSTALSSSSPILFSMRSSLLLKQSWIFSSIIFFSSTIPVLFIFKMFFYLFAWNSYFAHTLVFWLWWAPLWCYFEHAIRKTTYLHLIKICFWIFILFFCLEYIPLFFHFLGLLCAGFCTLSKVATSPSLDRVVLCRIELCQSSQVELLIASQTFVTAHATFFALSGSQ